MTMEGKHPQIDWNQGQHLVHNVQVLPSQTLSPQLVLQQWSQIVQLLFSQLLSVGRRDGERY